MFNLLETPRRDFIAKGTPDKPNILKGFVNNGYHIEKCIFEQEQQSKSKQREQ